MQHSKVVLLLSVIILMWALPTNGQSQNKTVADFVQATNPEFFSLLANYTNYFNFLGAFSANQSQYNLALPSAAALANATLPTNNQSIVNLIENHIFPVSINGVQQANFTTTNFTNNQLLNTLLNNSVVRVNIYGNPSQVYFNGVPVILSDQFENNGIVDVINGVLYPSENQNLTIYQYLVDFGSNSSDTNQNASLLVAFLAANPAIGALLNNATQDNNNLYTVFVPTSAAIANYNGTINASLVEYHVVPGVYYNQGLGNQNLTTLNGQNLTTLSNASGVFVNNVPLNITNGDISLRNGVIQFVNQVLTPSSFSTNLTLCANYLTSPVTCVTPVLGSNACQELITCGNATNGGCNATAFNCTTNSGVYCCGNGSTLYFVGGYCQCSAVNVSQPTPQPTPQPTSAPAPAPSPLVAQDCGYYSSSPVSCQSTVSGTNACGELNTCSNSTTGACGALNTYCNLGSTTYCCVNVSSLLYFVNGVCQCSSSYTPSPVPSPVPSPAPGPSPAPSSAFNTIADLLGTNAFNETTALFLIGANQTGVLAVLSNGTANVTLLLPSDLAFNNNLQLVINYTNLGLAGNLLLNHIIPGASYTSSLFNDQVLIPLLNSSWIRVNIYNGTYYFNGGAQVTQPNVNASNGVVDLIDQLITPITAVQNQTIYQFISSQPNLSDLTALINGLNLSGVLNSTYLGANNSYTVFAPDNQAFQALNNSIATLLSPVNYNKTLALALSHILNGTYYLVGLTPGQYQALSGYNLNISNSNVSNVATILVNGNQIVSGDNNLRNGVVQIINSVLIPANFTFNLTSAPQPSPQPSPSSSPAPQPSPNPSPQPSPSPANQTVDCYSIDSCVGCFQYASQCTYCSVPPSDGPTNDNTPGKKGYSDDDQYSYNDNLPAQAVWRGRCVPRPASSQNDGECASLYGTWVDSVDNCPNHNTLPPCAESKSCSQCLASSHCFYCSWGVSRGGCYTSTQTYRNLCKQTGSVYSNSCPASKNPYGYYNNN